jgi:hypothetical protein
MIQLSDLIEEPVNIYDKDFQKKITADFQFYSLKKEPQKVIKRGELFPHQEFDLRYLRLYPSLIIIDEPGTGKTCSVTGFAEYAFDQHLLSLQNTFNADYRVSNLKRTILLVKGETQANEFKQQILCRCSHRYEKILIAKEIENPKEKMSDSDKKRLITSVVKEWYDVYGYLEFSNLILKEFPNFLDETHEDREKAIRKYDDTVFWVDEAHNLINYKEHVNNIKDKSKRNTYYVLKTILHGAKRNKIIISTATPATNAPEDFTSVFNLALPPNGEVPLELNIKNLTNLDLLVHFPTIAQEYLKDLHTMRKKFLSQYTELSVEELLNLNNVELVNEIPTLLDEIFDPMRGLTRNDIEGFFVGQIPDDYKYKDATLEELNCYLRGRITYVRALDSNVIVINKSNDEYQGPIFDVGIKLYYSMMSDYQTEYYNHAYLNSTRKNDGVYNSARQAALFVFPDGTWGDNLSLENNKSGLQKTIEKQSNLSKDIDIINSRKQNIVKSGFGKYIIPEKNGKFKITKELTKKIKNLEDIKQYSSIYYEICKSIIEKEGNAFVYGDNMVYGSGIIVLSALLEILGFERMEETTSIFVDNFMTRKETLGYCPPDDTLLRKNRQVREKFLKKPRYALLTGETSKDFSIIMEAMNSYANRHGEYIKVLIVSRVGRDGINVSNVLSIHLITAAWNYAAIYQALMRGLRATSHYDLTENGNNVETSFYLHAAIPNIYNETREGSFESLDDNIESIDVKMYNIAVKKDKQIKRIMRMMKQIAVSCQINLNRNIRPAILDNSSLCDYQKCDYQCYENKPKKVNYHNYNILYAKNDIDNIVVKLMNIFKEHNQLSFEELKNMIKSRYLIYALEKIINQRLDILDRYGFPRYLHNQGDNYYLLEKYPDGKVNKIADNWYDNNLFALQLTDFKQIVKNNYLTQYPDIEKRLMRSNSIKDTLNDLNIDLQVYILEKAISYKIKNSNRNMLMDNILDYYKNYWYTSNEPLEELEESAKNIAKLHLRNGEEGVNKKIKAKIYNKKELQTILNNNNYEVVYFHNLYLLTPNQAKYANSSQYNKGAGIIRILKLSEEIYNIHWRDVLDYEYPVYNMLIQQKVKNVNEIYRENRLYGIVDNDGFKIVDIENEDPAAISDNRLINTGRACTSWKKVILFDYMYRSNVNLFNIATISTEQDINRLITSVSNIKGIESITKKIPLNEWSFEKLLYFDSLKNAGKTLTINKICQILREQFKKDGLLKVNI